MKEQDDIQQNIAQTAYLLLKYGYYGSERKAVSALRRRKCAQQYDPSFLATSLANATAIVRRLDDLAASILKKYQKSYHSQLTKDQFTAGEQCLKQALLSEFPESKAEIDYLIGMLWHMHYVK